MESIGKLTKKLERALWETMRNDPSVVEESVDVLYELPAIRKYTSLIEHYQGVQGTKEIFESLAQKALDDMHECGMLHAAVVAKG